MSRDGRGMWTNRIGPIEDVIADADELVVIPSGAMLGMPVETFVDGEGTLLDNSMLLYGSNMGNFGGVEAEENPCHNKPFSVSVTLPPLAALCFRPKRD